MRRIRPRHQPAFLQLAFAPGECAQVDGGSFGSVALGQTQRRLSCFVMVLCYSRLMEVECTVSQTMEHCLACHPHAFEACGGVPPNVMVDPLKSALLGRLLGQEPMLNPKYVDFADHMGFTLAPCQVGKGNEKGRVANGVGYVKKNFLAGLDLPPFSALNPAVKQWLDTGANGRIHGETRQPPLDLWQKEKAYLRPLPPHPFDIATVSQGRVSKQFRITVETNRYCVPAPLAGQVLTLKTYPDRLCLYPGDNRVARHRRSDDRHGDLEDPDHPKPLLEQRQKARDPQLFMRFLALCPEAETYDLNLPERHLKAPHHGRKIGALSDIYGQEPVARALSDALHSQAFASDYIANLLEQRTRFTPEASALHLTRREDLLELRLPTPDLSIYQDASEPPPHHP